MFKTSSKRVAFLKINRLLSNNRFSDNSSASLIAITVISYRSRWWCSWVNSLSCLSHLAPDSSTSDSGCACETTPGPRWPARPLSIDSNRVREADKRGSKPPVWERWHGNVCLFTIESVTSHKSIRLGRLRACWHTRIHSLVTKSLRGLLSPNRGWESRPQAYPPETIWFYALKTTHNHSQPFIKSLTLCNASENVKRLFSPHDTMASLSGCLFAVAFSSCPTFKYLNSSLPGRWR